MRASLAVARRAGVPSTRRAQLPPPCKGVPNIVEQRIIGRSSTAIGWLSVPAGAYLLEWEQAQFDREVADVFGYYALQIGLGELDCLRANRMPCRVFAGVPSSGPSEAAAVARPQATPPADEASRDASRSPAVIVHIAQPEELPFETQSLDLVALPHVLESTADPHQVLREVDRVLRPEGRLIVSGLNPVSLWGARHLLPGGLPPGLPARDCRLIAPPRLRDWLRLLGFEPLAVSHGCYRPPVRNRAWLDRTAFLENAGDRWWPICGAVYLQSAVKRVRAMRLVGPAWKRPVRSRAARASAALTQNVEAGGLEPTRRGAVAALARGEDFTDTCTRETSAVD